MERSSAARLVRSSECARWSFTHTFLTSDLSYRTEKLVRDIVTAFRTPSITRTASPSIKALLVALKAVVITYLVRGAGVQSLRGITLQSIQGLKSEQVLQVGVVARALAAVVVAFW